MFVKMVTETDEKGEQYELTNWWKFYNSKRISETENGMTMKYICVSLKCI